MPTCPVEDVPHSGMLAYLITVKSIDDRISNKKHR